MQPAAAAPPSAVAQKHLLVSKAKVPTSLLPLADNDIGRKLRVTKSWWHLQYPLCVLWVA